MDEKQQNHKRQMLTMMIRIAPVAIFFQENVAESPPNLQEEEKKVFSLLYYIRTYMYVLVFLADLCFFLSFKKVYLTSGKRRRGGGGRSFHVV